MPKPNISHYCIPDSHAVDYRPVFFSLFPLCFFSYLPGKIKSNFNLIIIRNFFNMTAYRL